MKKLLATILACAMAFAMVACGGTESTAPGSTDNPGTSSGGTDSKDPVTVTIWHTDPEDTEPTSVHQRILAWADKYNKENTDNITVEVSGGKTVDVILTTVASGGTPDIFANFWNNAAGWADKGAIYDLTDFVNNDKEWDKSDFVDACWGLCTYNDRVYSIPRTMSTTFMAYRPDILAENGWDHFPKDTDELLQCIFDCTKTDANGKLTQLGMVPDFPWLDNILWPAAFGGKWIDENGVPSFTDQKIIDAYEFQYKILDKYGYDEVRRFVDTFGARGTAQDPLFEGKVAMRWEADSGLAALEEFAGDTEWKLAPMPYPADGKGAQMLTCAVWEVNARTANPEATWKVLSSLTGKENMKFMAEGNHNNGAFMPRRSALEHLVNNLDVSEYAKDDANILLNDNLTHFPMTSYIGEYLNAINAEMTEAMMGNISVADAAAKVQEQMKELAAQ